MRRPSIPWCGACLLGLALLSGCRHTSHGSCPHCGGQAPNYPMARNWGPPPPTATACQVIRSPQQQQTAQWKACPPSCTPVMTDQGPALACVAEGQPRPAQAGGGQEVVPVGNRVSAPPARPHRDTLYPGEQVRYTTPSHSLFPRGEGPPPRRDHKDITAHPCMDHANDYSWLVGQVTYSRLSKGWTLRYASLEDDDPYGGSVTLTGNRQIEDLKDGQIVRVKGRLRDPQARTRDNYYIVDSIETIDP